jgi:GIY-YIG catalytic domain
VILKGQPWSLNELIERDGIDPKSVLVFRHRPSEPQLNKVFDWVVSERVDLFECYQTTHAPNTEAALDRAQFVASFIRYRPKQALFIGLYRKTGLNRILSTAECTERPLHRELMALGMSGYKASEGERSVVEFGLERTDWHLNWSERLIVEWPGLERSWYRWLDRNHFPISAIAEESTLRAPMPDWSEIVLDWHQLSVLPSLWRSALSHWRGIYLIIDQSDGFQYVGSAYGGENLMQRWNEYSRSGHGGNKGLRGRDHKRFRFSILQRVSPDMSDADVIAIENSWKDRLRSRTPFGLNEN